MNGHDRILTLQTTHLAKMSHFTQPILVPSTWHLELSIVVRSPLWMSIASNVPPPYDSASQEFHFAISFSRRPLTRPSSLCPSSQPGAMCLGSRGRPEVWPVSHFSIGRYAPIRSLFESYVRACWPEWFSQHFSGRTAESADGGISTGIILHSQIS
jgi:hypothetical protein